MKEHMKGIKELKAELGKSLDWHGSRLDFLAKFILALFKVKTVNLAQVATAFPGQPRWTLTINGCNASSGDSRWIMR
jgi:hypothetical protein